MEFPQYPLTSHSQEINRNQDEENHNTSSSNSTTNSSHLEQMFEKVVTPSDVGKLNRLVIPKQHAERYFPVFPQDASSSEKGSLLLNFEEIQSGKPWRFRYSYWNSSQSYVMTKGWSRFVKDKRLNAGDTVSFLRGYEGRLFIDWRRRVVVPEMPVMGSINVPSWGWGTPLYLRTMPQVRVEHGIMQSLPVAVPRSDMIEPVRRQVRLFGVNIDECNSEQEDPPSPLQWTLSSITPSATNTELQLMPRRTSSDDENNF